MLEKIVSRYALSELLEMDTDGYAIADNNGKFIWNNKAFLDITGKEKIAGKVISDVFSELNASTLKYLETNKSILLKPASINKNLLVTSLRAKKKTDGYFFKLEENNIKKEITDIETEIYQINLLFQKELNEVLSLLIKEKSLTVLADEIVKRAVDVTKSQFGLIVLQDDNKKHEFIWFDPKEIYNNKEELEKEINSSFSFMTKWLSVNKRSLMALNHPNNIGFNLAKSFSCESLIISPCVFDSVFSAALIVGKKKEEFPSFEINMVEQFAGIFSFAINSIKTKELNTALENRLLQSQKLETIGKLTSGMAHDFSNLLSSIFGSLNLLKRRLPANEDIFRLLDNIENCSVRAKDLTRGLLSFGKPTPKRKELIKPNILLSEISRVIIQTFPKKIDFEESVEEGLNNVLGNGTEIYQVLLNLCVNAKEAIESYGKIRLMAENMAVTEKNVMNHPLLKIGKYVHISVSDSGVGISEENLQKIFDPYFSTKEKETGSGLGLYVTYGIIKAHQGHIEVTSKSGEGTTFDVYLPAFEPAEDHSETKPSEKIILLADDEVMLSDLLSELLESSGFNVIKVTSGIEALKVLTEEIKVDLVILDYNMPQMNGLECVKQIRELHLDIPIILSSGSLALEEDFNLEDLGVNSLLIKPYEFDTMLATIKKLI